MRVFLIVSAWVLGFLILMVGAGFTLWSLYGDEYVAMFKDAAAQGEQVGATSSDQVCYDQIVDRLKTCSGLKCTLGAKTFAVSCFKNVKIKTEMCNDIPGLGNFLDYVEWLDSTCTQIAPENDACDKVIQEVAKYCMKTAG